MRPVDRAMLRFVWDDFVDDLDLDVKSVGLLSPDPSELELIQSVLPGRERVVLTRDDWDLAKPGRRDFDLLVACNVFMYSREPGLWFNNVLDRCRWFLLQDHVRSWRGGDVELGSDGDAMRYYCSVGVGACRPDLPEAYDLANPEPPHLFYPYEYTPEQGNGSGHRATSFVTLIRGHLS